MGDRAERKPRALPVSLSLLPSLLLSPPRGQAKAMPPPTTSPTTSQQRLHPTPPSPSASFPSRPTNPNPNPVAADAAGPTRPPPAPRLLRPLRAPSSPSPATLLARRAGALGFSSWTLAAPPRAAGAPTAAAAGSPTPRYSTSR